MARGRTRVMETWSESTRGWVTEQSTVAVVVEQKNKKGMKVQECGVCAVLRRKRVAVSELEQTKSARDLSASWVWLGKKKRLRQRMQLEKRARGLRRGKCYWRLKL